METLSETIFSLEQANKGVETLYNLITQHDNKRINITENSEPVFLQIECIKIPDIKKKIIRFPLPHSLLLETANVCLFVPDLIRGRKVDHEITVRRYKKLLDKKGITHSEITRIMPSREVRVDYTQYEAKRKLCGMFDVFLIDNKISSFLIPKLGKAFQQNRKWPIPIRLKSRHLKEEITSKLKKTSMVINNYGLTKIVQVGHTEMPSYYVAENIIAVINSFKTLLPSWSWDNVRCLLVKTRKSSAIPLYMSFASSNNVVVPKDAERKELPACTDELSIIGKKVTVYPSGHVRVHA